ncbi:alpha/beta-hydrolase [Atractiella rhizophila]|nr:alpha/beta-hydrolase [Atractiella rhizophila]
MKFFTKRWLPEGTGEGEGKVGLVFVHGFVEHIERYDHVFPIYAQKGIEVFAFDQRGSGQTAANTNFIDRELKLSKEKGVDKKLFLMGHSMGGGLVAAYATRHPQPAGLKSLSGVICSSPLIKQTPAVATSPIVLRVGSVIGSLAPGMQVKVGKEPKQVKEGEEEQSWRGDICRDKAVVKEYETDPYTAAIGSYKGVADMLLGGIGIYNSDYKKFPPKLPIYLFHGDADKVTWHQATEELAEKLKNDVKAVDVEFHTFPGFWHETHNEPGEDKWTSINLTSDWIIKHKDSPSLAKL